MQTLLVLFLFALPSALAGELQCPMNITQELDANPYMYQQCLMPDISHCCEGIQDIIKILQFAWVHTTRTFLLPDNGTAALCVDEFIQQLVGRGIDSNLLATCRVGLDNFITDSGTCNNITDIKTFERAVDPSELRQKCNASNPNGFVCRNCIYAMADALNVLNAPPAAAKPNCPAFIMMYVGGGINCYDGLGPDAAFCLLSVQNLGTIAANRLHVGGRKGLNGTTKTALEASVPSAGVIILFSVGVLWNLRRVRKTQQRKLMRRYIVLSESTGLTFFSFPEIKHATRNFAEENLVGEGGFGLVYRGSLPDGSQIAVKRFKESTKAAEEDFSHEVQVISSTKHRNLLPLRGYCVEVRGQVHEQLLVYDFMENGSLAEYLFSPIRPFLTWAQRYKIAVGIARGLAYLHEDTKPAIIHRDVKAANVLLDADLSPLVADFGMAKFKTDDKTHYTTRTVGTLGYVAPEYALYGHLNDKSDVFGFGIIVLELVTGRRAFDTRTTSLEHVLVSDWVVDMALKGRRAEIVDKRIRECDDGCLKESMERVLLLGLQCAHPRVVCRPSISQALVILEAIDHPSPAIISVLDSMEADLEATCNSRGDFTWLISPDTGLSPSSHSMTFSSDFSSNSHASGSRD